MALVNRSEVEKKYLDQSYPSIIDLYVDKTCILEDINKYFSNQQYFLNYDFKIIDNELIKIVVSDKERYYTCFIKIIDNDLNFDDLSETFVSNESKQLASNQKQCFSIYMSCDDVKSYYIQLRLISLLHPNTILIYDNNQDNLYSYGYLKHILNINVDPIDNNLFKINHYENGWLHTTGLTRFNIRELEFSNVDENNVKAVVTYIRNLALYMIKNGQEKHNLEVLEDVFGLDLITTLHNVDDISKLDYQLFNQLRDYRKIEDIYNHYFVEVKSNNDKNIFDQITNHLFYYRDEIDIQNNKQIAQLTLNDIVKFVEDLEDCENLMIFARNENFELDWYSYVSIDEKMIVLATEDDEIKLSIDEVYNWNYRGVIPLYSYMIQE